MNELDFRAWLAQNDVQPKVASDLVSRLKRVEREINHCDIDKEYRNDKCVTLLSYFRSKGLNAKMASLNTSFPVGAYHLGIYPHAIRKYIAFLEETTSTE